MREPDLAAAEKRARRTVRNPYAYPGLSAVYVKTLMEEYDRRGAELGELQSPWKRCPKWCDGPECDCPPRAGGACFECAEAHYAAHLAQVPRPMTTSPRS